MFTTPVYNSRRGGRFVNSAFLTRDVLPKKRSFFFLWQTKLKENVWRNSKFQVNRRTNTTWKQRLNSSNRAAMSTLHRKNDTTNLSGYKLGELTGNKKKALLFFSGKKKVQNFNGSVWTITPLFSEVIILRTDLVTVFDDILMNRQTLEKLLWLYENLMSNNFQRMAVLKKKRQIYEKSKASLWRNLSTGTPPPNFRACTLHANFSRMIWSVNQIVLFNGFLSDFEEMTSCVYTRTIILFNHGE